MLLCHHSERDCILATRFLPTELNRINFLSEPSIYPLFLSPFARRRLIKSTFFREAAIFPATCSFLSREKGDKTVGYCGEMETEKKEMEGASRRERKGREREDGNRVEYDLRVAYLSSIFDTRTRVSHLTRCVVADIMVSG